jgi:Flp pilus assembly protein TadB
MICQKCSEDKNCRTVPVYFGDVLKQETKTDRPNLVTYRTTYSTYYGKAEKSDVLLCDDCLINNRKFKLFRLAIIAFLAFCLCIFVILIDGITNDIEIFFLAIGGGIFLFIIGFVVRRLLKKQYTEFHDFDAYYLASTLLTQIL